MGSNLKYGPQTVEIESFMAQVISPSGNAAWRASGLDSGASL